MYKRQLYNELAWTYDIVSWLISLGLWKTWVYTTLPHLRGEAVLELAHGPGHLLQALVERGLHPIGLDLSPYMGHLARRRLSRRGYTVPLVRAYAQVLPFRNACFTAVVATFPTEFILDPATLREVARVLRSEGRLVIVPWALPRGSDPLSRFLGWLYRATGQTGPPYPRWEAGLKEAGFAPRVIRERIRDSEVMLIVAEKEHIENYRTLS